MDDSRPVGGSSGVVTPDTSIEEAIEQYASIKSKGGGGRFAAESKRMLEKQYEDHWKDLGVETVDDLRVLHFRHFAERLYRRAYAKEQNPNTGITGTTAVHYYNLVHGFTVWLEDHNALDKDLAGDSTVVEQLPDKSVGRHETEDEQFWSEETREQIVRWADWRFENAADYGWMEPRVASRDRALVALLAYSGLRGAEALRDPRNDRRAGLRWTDLDLEAETVRVLGKSQEYEEVPVLGPAVKRLQAHKRRLDPPQETWPVFQSEHLVSLYKALPDDVDASPDTVHELIRDHDVTPPSINVNAGRRILKTLSQESGIREDGELLKPHGARRGIGDLIYHEVSPQRAQSLLRHRSIETTHRHYAQDDTERTRAAVEEAVTRESPEEE